MNFPNSTTIKVSGLNFRGPFSSAQPLLNHSGVYVILTRGALPGSQWQVLSVAALYTQGFPDVLLNDTPLIALTFDKNISPYEYIAYHFGICWTGYENHLCG